MTYRFFHLRVVRAVPVGASQVRITLGGPGLDGFVNAGRDQRVKVFLPRPHQAAPLVPTAAGERWYDAWREMDGSERAHMRNYTVRALRPGELDIDFGLHDGPAARWAGDALPGDPVTVLGPYVEDNGGVDFRPPPGTDWHLIAADESALPAAEGILAWLPPGARARVFLEVPDAADIRDLPTAAETEVTWLVRRSAATPLPSALRAAALPGGTPYAWVAGESGTVRSLRRHLVGDRGFDRHTVTFTGYWRRGTSEDDMPDEPEDLS